jgi:hypothetical protein
MDPELLYATGLAIATLAGFLLESRRGAQEHRASVGLARETAALRCELDAVSSRLEALEDARWSALERQVAGRVDSADL